MSNKAHIKYKLKCGTLVPGVTTILNILDKPALVAWAYNCGVKGIDYRKARDTAGDIGTLTHYLILCDMKGDTPDVSEYSPADYEIAKRCLKNYFVWKENNHVKPIMVEVPLISEKFGYGGTLDLYAELNSQKTLIDFKTGKGIYDSFLYQTAAYGQLILENTGEAPENTTILRIPKDEWDSFETRSIKDTYKYFEVFRHALCIYKLQKELS